MGIFPGLWNSFACCRQQSVRYLVIFPPEIREKGKFEPGMK